MKETKPVSFHEKKAQQDILMAHSDLLIVMLTKKRAKTDSRRLNRVDIRLKLKSCLSFQNYRTFFLIVTTASDVQSSKSFLALTCRQGLGRAP